MSRSLLRQTIAFALALAILSGASAAQEAGNQAQTQITIPPETKARLTLYSEINTKLSEPDDVITASLVEPIFVDGRLLLQRGTIFHGRVIKIAPAKRGQKSSHVSIIFDSVVLSDGVAPISAQVTAMEDWANEDKYKADSKGRMKGGHRGEKTVDNMHRGARLGFGGSLVALLFGGAVGAGPGVTLGIAGAGLAAGMITGLFSTKGSEIRVKPGTVLRIK